MMMGEGQFNIRKLSEDDVKAAQTGCVLTAL